MTRDASQKYSLLRWVPDHITEPGTNANEVSSSMPIIKDSLNFDNRFWWAVVYTRIWKTHIDNTLMLSCTVLTSSIIAGYDIN